MKPSTSRIATGSLKPDSPSSVVASRRLSVDPRSSAKIAAPSVAASTDPSSSPSSVERSKSHAAAKPVTAAVTIVPTSARLKRRCQHGADLEQPRGQAALEEDQGQRDDPDPAREPVVVEVDPAQAVGADGHAQEEEEQQAGHAQAPRDERGEQAGGQQRAGDQDEFPVRQAGSI